MRGKKKRKEKRFHLQEEFSWSWNFGTHVFFKSSQNKGRLAFPYSFEFLDSKHWRLPLNRILSEHAPPNYKRYWNAPSLCLWKEHWEGGDDAGNVMVPFFLQQQTEKCRILARVELSKRHIVCQVHGCWIQHIFKVVGRTIIPTTIPVTTALFG